MKTKKGHDLMTIEVFAFKATIRNPFKISHHNFFAKTFFQSTTAQARE